MSGAPRAFGLTPPPLRRGYAIASLVLGILSVPTVGLLLVGAMLSVILGVVALVKASRAPEEYGGKGMAIAGIVLAGVSVVIMPFVLGVGAAIVIPSLLRARVSANESAAIADVRTLMAAEDRYRLANRGYYDTLECLWGPDSCIPGYQGPSLIEPRLRLRDAAHGYHRWFYAGPTVRPTPEGASRSSLAGYAYVAFPERPGTTGVRWFCGDSSGRLCFVRSAGELAIVDGACPADCTRLD
jgi:type II secretory pathway pseudopilin PulG